MFYRICVFMVCAVLHGLVYADFVVDVFGDPSAQGARILHQYQDALITLVKKRITFEEKYHDQLPQTLAGHFLKKRQKLCDRIKKAGGYAYVNYDVVYYPVDGRHYITLEVILSRDKQRLKWIVPPPFPALPHVEAPDLIQSMQAYLDEGYQLIRTHQLDVSKVACTGYHCLFGFDHPRLKPYRYIFDQGIQTQHAQIVASLKRDPDPERRLASAYLVGEFGSPDEILSLLAPQVVDQDEGVRNAVVRVIADTMHRSGLKAIAVEPFIELLDSPHETDRNKALFVLLEAADLPAQRESIARLATGALQRLSQLKQPNNRRFAEQLLEKIKDHEAEAFHV